MPNLFVDIRDDENQRSQTPPSLTEEQALELLQGGEFTAAKLIPWGSNYSFAVALDRGEGEEHLAIYKPQAGEAPLHDFPDGTLFLREVASYLLSKQLDWGIVPPTIVREGPHGIGSLQLYIEPMEGLDDPSQLWGACTLDIERLVLFDHIANNADRKLTHCLLDGRRKVWGIDHGLTFNHVPKMRTVLWQFIDRPIAPPLVTDLDKLMADRSEVEELFADYLAPVEIDAFFARVERMRSLGRYPRLHPHRNIPYGWW
jgi:hypothetical protein